MYIVSMGDDIASFDLFFCSRTSTFSAKVNMSSFLENIETLREYIIRFVVLFTMFIQ